MYGVNVRKCGGEKESQLNLHLPHTFTFTQQQCAFFVVAIFTRSQRYVALKTIKNPIKEYFQNSFSPPS